MREQRRNVILTYILQSLLGSSLCLSTPSHAVEKDEVAPAFSLPAANSETEQTLESYKGSFVYLDFWASWCVPCRASLPWLAELPAKITNTPLTVVTINLDEDWAAAEALLKTLKVANLTVLKDPKGAVAEKYNLRTMPTSFLLDPTGKVIARMNGFTEEEKEVTEKLLASLKK